MQVYYWVVILVLLFSALAQHNEKVVERSDGSLIRQKTSVSNASFLVLSLIMICVAGLRYYVGTDYGAYYNGYWQAANNLLSDFYNLNEPGYGVLSLVAVWLGEDGAVAVFLASAITIGISLFVIYRNTDRLTFAFLLYLFVGCWSASFNAVRQCLAGAFVFLGYNSLKERRFWRYCIYVVIAFLFHRSAALMLVVYFLVHRRVSFGNILIIIIGAFVIASASDFVRTLTENILIQDLEGAGTYLTTTVNTFRVLVGVAPAVFFLITLSHHEKTDDDIFHLNILIFHAAISAVTFNSAYFARYTIYSAPFLTIAIPELTRKYSRRNRGIITIFILLLYLGFWLYELNHSIALNNFRWIWER